MVLCPPSVCQGFYSVWHFVSCFGLCEDTTRGMISDSRVPSVKTSFDIGGGV